MQQSWFGGSTGGIAQSSSVQEGVRAGSASALIEHMQSQLKQKDGEIAQIQVYKKIVWDASI